MQQDPWPWLTGTFLVLSEISYQMASDRSVLSEMGVPDTQYFPSAGGHGEALDGVLGDALSEGFGDAFSLGEPTASIPMSNSISCSSSSCSALVFASSRVSALRK